MILHILCGYCGQQMEVRNYADESICPECRAGQAHIESGQELKQARPALGERGRVEKER
jgi:Zn finger protein HypA/HybF involved in hydrogenase expression